MVLAVLLMHAVLLPVLFYGMIRVVRTAQEEVFIDHVRIYSRVFADLLQTSEAPRTDEEIIAHLDSTILGGRCVHAAIKMDDRRLYSTVMDSDDGGNFVEDFQFNDHDDNVYYLSTPVQLGASLAVLELGFDEEPTVLEIEGARITIRNIVLAYLLVSVIFAILLSNVLSKPLRRLRRDSRLIASGDYARHISTRSTIFEIAELSRDIEHMRSTLVGVNARLEAEIASREQAESERRRAERHLRHAHRLQSIGTLAGGIAHEINNVLLPILLYTDLALEDLPQDSPVRPNLERVVKLAKRAKGLSEQILTFGRQSGDAMVVVPDLAPLVDEAMSMVRALIPASIEIVLNIERPVGPVLCNPNEVQQLLVNLCSNAYKSLLKGVGRVWIGLENCSVSAKAAENFSRLQAGNCVRLSVSDDGEGMDSATIERMFDPFFTTRAVGQGTGLGLSVVHGIVVSHGGEVVVSSEVGAGTSIDIYLPRVDDQGLGSEGRLRI